MSGPPGGGPAGLKAGTGRARTDISAPFSNGIFIFGIDELFEFSMVGCKIDGCLIFHEKAEKSLRHIPA